MVDSTGLKPKKNEQRPSIKFIVAVAWLVFTMALAGWWLIYGLMQIENLQAQVQVGQPEIRERLERQHRMLLSEGIVLLLLLVSGGGAILYGIRVESGRARQIEEFFASFTHDLKNSLASLRIQTESLMDEGGSEQRLLRRILSDTGRLETQLENALYLAEADRGGLHVEPVSIRKVVNDIAPLWPELAIEVDATANDVTVMADRRAMESVVRNLAQNALKHGGAKKLTVTAEVRDDFGRLTFRDDGRGFSGDATKLGEIFQRHTGTSGSGIGLYLVAKLVERHGGQVAIRQNQRGDVGGFAIDIELPRGKA